MVEEERRDWGEYHRSALENFEVPPLVQRLTQYLPSGGDAIDLGCSVGRALPPLLERGLNVTAVDADPTAIAMLRERLPDENITTIVSRFEDLTLGSYDVAIANYSLFFIPRDDYTPFWKRLVDAIKPGGLLAVVFLGPNDDWRETNATHSREEVLTMLEPFERLYFMEEDGDGQLLTGGGKHWHVFHAIGRKRG